MESDSRRPLDQETRKLESQELKFQEHMNNRNYLTWDKVSSLIDDEGFYHVTDGHTWTAGHGRDLITDVRQRVETLSCTFLTEVQAKPPNQGLDLDQLWVFDPHNQRDAAGRRLVLGHNMDYWSTEYITSQAERYDPEETDEELARQEVSDLIAATAETEDMDDYEILAQIFELLVHIYRCSYAQAAGQGTGAEGCHQIAAMRTLETLQRSYHGSRIARAGIDLKQMPHLATIQYFYDQGLPPPTHRQAADHIIAAFAAPEQTG